jgi:hypothetical protein
MTIKKKKCKTQLINISQEKRQSGSGTSFSPGTSAFCLTITLKRPDYGSVEPKHVALSVFLTINLDVFD